jgi:hypothetical protein
MAVVSLQSRMPAKNLKRITTYVQPEVFEALEEWADIEDRPLSNLVGRLLSQAVKERQEEAQGRNQQEADNQ